ncbi:tRNA lysidine(34) synthetase TilS [Clostridium polynesiense]|uniref:tRNA lysidine(34) synthetase TilS n=1 Tax=Clostridium polynesiense TaxID=1325933 RepID=UPI00058CE2E2|nr:tRNA lysidine(34) synthetase TilS [Clostridium polynesiense]
MKDKVLRYIKEHSMLNPGDRVLVALSGGPDSVCLIHLLHTLEEELNIKCFAAHINHCLRGEDSDKDEAYAEELCGRLNITFFSKKIDINLWAKEKGISTEMAGREARYDFFEFIKNEYSLNKIALAHNANDQAETILMRMIRGTGSEGLRGIRPVRDGIFIRPILILSRKEIEEYCEENNLNPRIDKTNLEELYYRNKIRLQLIPYIQENFNPNIISSLNRLAILEDIDNDFIDKEADINYEKFCIRDSKEIIIKKDAFSVHRAVLSRLIRKAFNDASGFSSNFEKVHVEDIIALQKQGTGKSISLPGGMSAENRYSDIYLVNKNLISAKGYREEYLIKDLKDIKDELTGGLNVFSKEFNYTLVFKLTVSSEKIQLKNNNAVKYFDFDKIKGSIILRSRKDGDRFNPLGMKGTKKLKDIFIDLKIPQVKRNEIPLICFDDDIAWIIGYKISDKYKVDINTKNILQINIESEAVMNERRF